MAYKVNLRNCGIIKRALWKKLEVTVSAETARRWGIKVLKGDKRIRINDI